jgi:hypothetical protein
MIERLLSGGQTGADQAGWRAARACGLATGGWMPRGFLTEGGPRPEFADLYGARAMPTDAYRLRTEQNVRDSHATLWFGDTGAAGAKATLNACAGMGRPVLRIGLHAHEEVGPSDVAAWLRSNPGITRLNIAGNRESRAPGIGRRVERFLTELFGLLGHPPVQPTPPAM